MGEREEGTGKMKRKSKCIGLWTEGSVDVEWMIDGWMDG